MEHLRAYFKANRGKQQELATLLGLGASTVSQWQNVPAEHVLAVENFTGISRHVLRPDVFGAVAA